VLDLLWAVGSYERLVGDWNLEPDEAIRGVRWVVGLVEDAIGNDERPPRSRRGRLNRP